MGCELPGDSSGKKPSESFHGEVNRQAASIKVSSGGPGRGEQWVGLMASPMTLGVVRRLIIGNGESQIKRSPIPRLRHRMQQTAK